MRILLVEDDLALCGLLRHVLSAAGHRLDVSSSLEEAEYLWRVQEYDAVLLDLQLPRTRHPNSGLGSGLTLLRSARSRGDATPVLVLTASNEPQQRIAGLDAGADDYLGKPFDVGEVEARLRALIRRVRGVGDRVLVGALSADRRTGRFYLRDAPLELPAREAQVLWELLTPPGRVVSKQELATKLSGFDDLLAQNALEAFISRLRRKLANCGLEIRTLRGQGYLLEPEGSANGEPPAIAAT